jgi:hypothetical protein
MKNLDKQIISFDEEKAKGVFYFSICEKFLLYLIYGAVVYTWQFEYLNVLV